MSIIETYGSETFNRHKDSKSKCRLKVLPPFSVGSVIVFHILFSMIFILFFESLRGFSDGFYFAVSFRCFIFRVFSDSDLFFASLSIGKPFFQTKKQNQMRTVLLPANFSRRFGFCVFRGFVVLRIFCLPDFFR
ncbi:MAG: hypothetical protein KKB25_01545 [Nanoarchaeota archaeon]|nr:hypothetical protein [Nanoarchaeota archaeon]